MHDSGFGRLIGVLVSPGKTFQSIAARPTWVWPLLVFILFGAVSAYLTTERLDFREMFEKQAEARGGQQQMTEAQQEQAIEMAERFGGIGALVMAIVGSPLIYLLIALLFWGAFRFFGGSDFSFKASFATTLHALMPWAVASLLSIPLILGRETIGYEESQRGLLASSLATFAPDDASPVLLALLGSLDFFSFWTLVLLIIGYRTVARVKTGTAAVTILAVWLFYVGIKVGWVAIFS